MSTMRFVGFETHIMRPRTYVAMCERAASGYRPASDGRTDVYAPDRVISRGHRVVSRKGSVRFGGDTWTSEELVPLAGCAVEVSFVDVHMCSIYVAEIYGDQMLRIDRAFEYVAGPDDDQPAGAEGRRYALPENGRHRD